MAKKKILVTVIKEADGGFSVLGQPGKDPRELIAAQADSWEEVKERTLAALNTYLKGKGKAPLSLQEIDFGFDLPGFLDTYPQLEAAALLPQGVAGRKKVSAGQLDRILAAVKQLGSQVWRLSA